MTTQKKRAGALTPVWIEGGAVGTTQISGDVSTVKFPNASYDKFFRDRVSTGDGNRFDYDSVYGPNELLDQVTAGGGTITFDNDTRDETLAVNDAVDATEAALYGYDTPYTAGSGQLIDITGTLDNAAIGGGTAFLFLRSSITGSVVETTYEQSAWNIATVDDMDWGTSQILIMDFQSLRVGSITFYFSRDGVITPVHQINNDNLRAAGYWQTPNLPPYWRIYNDATYTYMEMGYGDTANGIGLRYRIAANASATMRAICGTVKSEAADRLFEMPGFQRAIDMGVTTKSVSTTLIPLISIRPAATFNSLTNRGLYIPTGYSLQASNAIRYVVLYRPTLTDPNFTAVDATNSGMEYDVTASAVSNGVIIDSDYGGSGGNNARLVTAGILGRVLLKLGRTGTSDILTLAAIRSSNSDSATLASLKWKEIR